MYFKTQNVALSLKRSTDDIRIRWNKFMARAQERPIDDYKNLCLEGRIALYGAGKYGKSSMKIYRKKME